MTREKQSKHDGDALFSVCRPAGCFDAAWRSSRMLHQCFGTPCCELQLRGRFLRWAEITACLDLLRTYIRAGCKLLWSDWGSQLQVHEIGGGQTLARLQALPMTHRSQNRVWTSEDELLGIFPWHMYFMGRLWVWKHLCKGTFSHDVCNIFIFNSNPSKHDSLFIPRKLSNCVGPLFTSTTHRTSTLCTFSSFCIFDSIYLPAYHLPCLAVNISILFPSVRQHTRVAARHCDQSRCTYLHFAAAERDFGHL